MVFDFLSWFFLIGLLIAVFQDLKRQEIDNWLNLFLIFGSFAYLVFDATQSNSSLKIFIFAFTFFVMFFVSTLFYYGRFFAGGDANLLFAMTAFFVGATFFQTLSNIGLFLLFLMFGGAMYGLIWIGVLFVRNFKPVCKNFRKGFSNVYFKLCFSLGIVSLFFCFVDFIFIAPAVLLIGFPVFYVFAKSLEGVAMTRKVSPSELVEGDWLVEEVQIGKKIIRASWDGISKIDIALLKRRNKKVLVKYGLPFAPAFLIAFLGYVFLKSWLLGFFRF